MVIDSMVEGSSFDELENEKQTHLRVAGGSGAKKHNPNPTMSLFFLLLLDHNEFLREI